MSNVSLLR